MKTNKGDVVIRQLDEGRYAVSVDGIVRYVGTQEEWRAAGRNPGSEERSRFPGPSVGALVALTILEAAVAPNCCRCCGVYNGDLSAGRTRRVAEGIEPPLDALTDR